MVDPSTLDTPSPRISWVNTPSSASARAEGQSAYQIQVATSSKALSQGKCDVWDTGKRKSADSYLIPYEGKALRSATDYFYRVRVWDLKGKVSAWSQSGRWGMGLLQADEWKGQWIAAPWEKGNAPLLRKSFRVGKTVRQAKMFISGLGYFELYMNGKRVGDDYLVPNFTNYTSRPGLKKAGIALDDDFRAYRVLYLSYDVTKYLQQGNNAMGVILGNGFYDCVYRWVCTFGHPCLLCQLKVTYTDGTEELVTSDTSWKVSPSPIVQNGPYIGELYDARLEDASWASASCDDATWRQAVLAPKPDGALSAQSSPGDKVTEVLKPKSVKEISSGRFEVDFGKEISGWIRVNNLQAKAGDTLDVSYVCESPLGIHKYVFKDDKPVSYAPRFTWYVFSKAVISGVDHLSADQLQAEAVNTDVQVNASFACNNSLFNQIVEIWTRSQIDNMHGCVASDCPHRERSPYTGDGQIASAMVMSTFDAASFYEKWIRDMRDVQNVHDGYVPNGAPWQPGCGGGVAWGAAMNVMPWEYYLRYGDRKMLEDNFEPMRMQVDYMFKWLTADSIMFQQKTNYGTSTVQKWLNLGDWSPAYGMPATELVHTFFLWQCLDYTARAARALDKKADAKHYADLAERIRMAFHRKFYNAAEHSYGDFGSNIYALKIGVPEDVKADVLRTLRQEIMVKYKGHINTGFVAARFFFEVLAENGMIDVAYTVLNQRDFPSFGYWIAQGATVTWEQWDGGNSRNHPMFGGGLVWLYRHLAGVRMDESAPGYRHFLVDPVFCDSITSARYAVESPYGTVSSSVHVDGARVTYDIQVPVGSTATLILPDKRRVELRQGRHHLTHTLPVKP